VTDTAAFFRFEGAIVEHGVLAASAYMAANGQGFGERLLRLGQVALSVPVYGLLGQSDRTLANRVAHLAYRGISEDRVAVLSEEYYENVLKNKVLDCGLALIKQARKEGHKIVVMSEGLEHIVKPVIQELDGIDHLVCNRLEFKNELATGKLLEPVIGGHDGGRWVREYADEHNIDLAASVAYAAHGADLLLLAAVGGPCAVNPDFTLRRAAQEADWPVMEYQQ
jgi:phosphoserine phosphatase